MILQDNQLYILSHTGLTKVDVNLFSDFIEIKLLSNHLLLGNEQEFLFLEAKTSVEEMKVFRLVIKNTGEVEFDY